MPMTSTKLWMTIRELNTLALLDTSSYLSFGVLMRIHS